jgi:hypothetical protein
VDRTAARCGQVAICKHDDEVPGFMKTGNSLIGWMLSSGLQSRCTTTHRVDCAFLNAVLVDGKHKHMSTNSCFKRQITASDFVNDKYITERFFRWWRWVLLLCYLSSHFGQCTDVISWWVGLYHELYS